MQRSVQTIDDVIIRFAGDSGDGMQLTGTQFTNTSAIHGNDLSTFPDFPAEIRAPAGTLAGVSGFQLHFSSNVIHTPGDEPGVLVAMNPAALKANLKDLKAGGMIIVNTDKFTKRDLEKAECETNPLEDGSLEGYQLVPVQLGKLTKESVKGLGLGAKEADRCKNFFALGMTYWLFNRDSQVTEAWIKGKFKPPYDKANLQALAAGFNYADTVQLFHSSFEVPPAKLAPGVYRNITGNAALALGFVTASSLAGQPLFQGAYPITPASDLLHYLSKYKDFGVITFQAEDEIAAISAAIGAAFGGAIAVTSSSGPGIALKGEALGLAMITELPMVVVDVQRGGPSTGLPTKTEQSDIYIALYGRHGESPMPVLAASTPSDCFWAAIEAVKIAVKYKMPVMLLTDGYLANGAEPWRLPDLEELPEIKVEYATEADAEGGFLPYERDPLTLARKWAKVGTKGLEHRIGGLEKQEGTGNVSYDPANHEYMCKMRAEKVARVLADIPDIEVYGDADGLGMVSWGGTYGSVRSAVDAAREAGVKVGHVHIRWLNPFPANLEAVLKGFEQVIVAELNLGQLVTVLRSTYLLKLHSYAKIQGQPFKVSELLARIQTLTS
ncbi:MAG: 2-oxoglutarate ferredoxin oxidoreductase subunit alpha [Myxococcota bacterium]|jgi:2-oxoglutarate ferredoxin oxidoreductase subunit alpha